MTPEAAEGHITAAPFFEPSPSARGRFVSHYKLRYGSNAAGNRLGRGGLFSGASRRRALDRAGTDDPEQVSAGLHEAEFDAPQGRVRIDASNNHSFLWPRVARLDVRGKFQIVWNLAFA